MTTYRPAPDVAWVSKEELDLAGAPTAYAVLMPRGPARVLSGPACLIWLALVEGGTLDEVVTTTADLAGVAPEVVRGDVKTLVEALERVGLVTHA